MSDFNIVILSGKIASEPEMRYIPSGTPVLSAKLISMSSFEGKDGSKKTIPLTIELSIWGRAAEKAKNELILGCEVEVAGRLQSREWQSKSGFKNVAHSISVEKIRVTAQGPMGAPEAAPSAPTPMEKASEVDNDELPF